MYSFESKVRYSEINGQGRISLESIVNYLQDCSTFHSEALGVGIDYLKKEHRAWVVNSWQIVIKEELAVGDSISVCTWPYEFKGFLGRRNFTISHGDSVCVEADSLWTHLDYDTMRPVKASAELVTRYGIEPALEMEKLGRKIEIPKELEEKEHIKVKRYHLDTNGHMNNGKYVALAEEYLPEEFHTMGLRVEYRKSALYGDEMVPNVWMNEEKSIVIVDLRDSKGISYATVEFRGEKR